jgi:hypothetical protein
MGEIDGPTSTNDHYKPSTRAGRARHERHLCKHPARSRVRKRRLYAAVGTFIRTVIDMCRKVVSALIDVTSRRAERTKNTAAFVGPFASTLAATVVGNLIDDINVVLSAAGSRQVSATMRDSVVKNVSDSTKYAISTFSDLRTTIASTVTGAAKAYVA